MYKKLRVLTPKVHITPMEMKPDEDLYLKTVRMSGTSAG